MAKITLDEKQCEFLYNLLDNVNLTGRSAIVMVAGILNQLEPHQSKPVVDDPQEITERGVSEIVEDSENKTTTRKPFRRSLE
jgi:hypothetical protein